MESINKIIKEAIGEISNTNGLSDPNIKEIVDKLKNLVKKSEKSKK